MSLTESLHLANAQRGMGHAKIAARMISAHKWNDPARYADAMSLLAVLGGKTMASWEAGKENGNG